ncbi:MAG: hypothetical protein WAN35_15595 [Terracidiphilus sp.]
MAIVRNLLLLCLALLTWTAASAAGLPLERSFPFAISGVYSITFNLQIASTLPAGSTITCRARMTPIPEALDLRNAQLAATPMAEGQVSVTGSTATCAAEIPFAWTVTRPPDGVELLYEIDAVSLQGGAPVLLRTSAQRQISAAFPAAGGSSYLLLNLVF